MLCAAVGIATALVVGIEGGIDAVLRERGADQATAQARETLTRAESRLQRATTALTDLVAAGVSTCRQTDIEAMRRAVYTTTPLKEVALVDDQGAVLCSHHGFGSDHKAMTAEQGIVGVDVTISVVRFGDGQEPALRLRAELGPPHLAVLVPAEVFATEDVATSSNRFGVRLILAGMPTVVREAGEAIGPGGVHVALNSAQFPVTIEFVGSLAGLRAATATPILYARAGGFVVVVLVLALALSATRRRDDPVAELRAALDAGELVPFYQPVMDIVSGRLVGCEVLVRWRKASGELIPPGVFIPLAESSGLIIDLTLQLMRAARDELAAVYHSRDLEVGFNIHADHFCNDRIVADVQEVFGSSPIALSQIMLEMTERAPLADLDDARRTIARLQAHGIKVAIDDVGTGHGGLNYLLKLGVDVIKVDKMFVDAIGSERYSSAIIETLVELGRSMKIDVIAEGVETFEQVEYLRDHGIHLAQGFVFAPALPGPAFLDLAEAMCRPATPVTASSAPRYRSPRPRYISARARHYS